MRFEEFKRELEGLEEVGRGWRGVVYRGSWKGREVAVKVARSPEKEEAIRKEGRVLEMLKGRKGFPQLLFAGEDFIVYGFIKGRPLGKLRLSEEDKKRVYREVLELAYLLDELGINKDEFADLRKNALVTDEGEVYLIDFERSSFKENPSNVRQFLQLLRREGFVSHEEAVRLGKAYKENRKEVINEIRKLLT
ncbi:MAG: hypothetical protein GXO03_01105 [Aquificae bacterium]|nr:hypothetical protein [Aquificota bacterium]